MKLPSAEDQPLLPVSALFDLYPNRGRSGVYDAIRRGELPTLRSGGRIYVITAQLRQQLGLDPINSEAPSATDGAIATTQEHRLAPDDQHRTRGQVRRASDGAQQRHRGSGATSHLRPA